MVKVFFPHPPGAGGPGSFQKRFEEALIRSDFSVNYSKQPEKPDIIIIVGGTRKIFWLILNKFKGVPIIYRLDGIQWLHKKQFRKAGIKKYVISEIHNYLSKFIQGFLADFIIYQSDFVREWWQREQWVRRNRFAIIYNSVDLSLFHPIRDENFGNEKVRIVFLEGHIDYSPYAIDLINKVCNEISYAPVEVYGSFSNSLARQKFNGNVDYRGLVERNDLPSVFKGAIYVSLDIHAACPNTVIEALACGAPVVGFDTGSLKELVINGSGMVVPYGSNPWELAKPDFAPLILGIGEVYRNYPEFSRKARELAIARYSLEDMFKKYQTVINDCLP